MLLPPEPSPIVAVVESVQLKVMTFQVLILAEVPNSRAVMMYSPVQS